MRSACEKSRQSSRMANNRNVPRLWCPGLHRGGTEIVAMQESFTPRTITSPLRHFGWPATAGISLLLTLLLAIAFLRAAPPATSTPTPTPSTSASERFEREIAAFEAADKVVPPPQGAVLFV